MKRMEAQRLSATQVRRMNGSSRPSNGIGLLVAPTDTWELVERSEKEPIYAVLLSYYEWNVTQKHEAPFMQEPLLSLLVDGFKC